MATAAIAARVVVARTVVVRTVAASVVAKAIVQAAARSVARALKLVMKSVPTTRSAASVVRVRSARRSATRTSAASAVARLRR